MARFLAGVAATLLLMTGAFFMWQAQADRGLPPVAPPPPGPTAPLGLTDLAPPPAATERTREQRRFARYDKDKNGAVAREEYLAARRKAFAKLDTNGDGRLGFEEYVIKTATKFAAADRDRNAALTPTEFAATRVVRKTAPRCACPPARGPVVAATPAPDEPEEN